MRRFASAFGVKLKGETSSSPLEVTAKKLTEILRASFPAEAFSVGIGKDELVVYEYVRMNKWQSVREEIGEVDGVPVRYVFVGKVSN